MSTLADLIEELHKRKEELYKQNASFPLVALAVGFVSSTIFIWESDPHALDKLNNAINEGGEPLGILGVTAKNGELIVHTSPLPEYAEEDWAKKYLRLVSSFIAQEKVDDRKPDADKPVSMNCLQFVQYKKRTSADLIEELHKRKEELYTQSASFPLVALAVGFISSTIFIWESDTHALDKLNNAINEGGEPLGVLGVTAKNGELIVYTSPLRESAEEDWVKKYLRLVSSFIAQAKVDDRKPDHDKTVSMKPLEFVKAKSFAER